MPVSNHDEKLIIAKYFYINSRISAIKNLDASISLTILPHTLPKIVTKNIFFLNKINQYSPVMISLEPIA